MEPGTGSSPRFGVPRQAQQGTAQARLAQSVLELPGSLHRAICEAKLLHRWPFARFEFKREIFPLCRAGERVCELNAKVPALKAT